MSDRLALLEYYCSRGWPLFPVHWLQEGACSCAASGCSSPAKHPLVKGGFKAASAEFARLQAWHARWPCANWGLRTGERHAGGAGLFAVDIDARSGGFATWDYLRAAHPEPLETVTVRTGGGGMHLWFACPPGLAIRSKAGALGTGIDIRAEGGYVLVPPSQTAAAYTFTLSPQEVEVAPCPDWLLELLAPGASPGAVRPPTSARAGQVVAQGQRHQAILSMAGAMQRVGMHSAEMRAALQAVRDQSFAQGDHPVSDGEIGQVVQWVSQKGRPFALTDLGNAERFVELHAGQVRYCYEWGQWLAWDGRRWAVNAQAEVYLRAFQTVRTILSETTHESDGDKRKAIAKHALASEAHHRVENMLKCARPYLALRADQLDQHPMLFNAANGMLDLASGALLPHDPACFLTHLAEIAYDPHAQCPGWLEFLELVTGGDPGLQAFLQRAAGYTLSGSTDEHCLFFLYGSGKNGKTTFIEALRLLLGEYAQRIEVEALLQSWGQAQSATPYIAQMKGKRLVLASEAPENRRLNEALVKDLTGGDAVTARHLFANPFTFVPTHKLWVFGNYKPAISGSDEGIWRRIRVIPFSVTIPEELRRPLSKVIEQFSAELPGILAWAVAGCLRWQAQGLAMSGAVRTATREYRSEQDLVQQFLDEQCQAGAEFSVDKHVLYGAWQAWCEAAGEREATRRSKKWLTQQMTGRGYTLYGNGKGRLKGLKIKG